MKRTLPIFLLITLALMIGVLGGSAQPPASAAPPLQATATPGVSVDPGGPTPTPAVATAQPGKPGGSVAGTPISKVPPRLKAPKSLDELRAAYPDLGPFIDKYKDAKVGDIPMAELYVRIVELYDKEGATGVATFLEESGLLDKLNIPLSYLDLLREFDKGGAEAVEALATLRGIINEQDEIIGYLALDSEANVQVETDRLTALGVSVYGYADQTEELEIGIPLAILGQLQTPGRLLGYLSQVADSPHIVGFRAPAPRATSGLRMQDSTGVGAVTIGADKWHAAGITGKGVKVGILDSGFGGILDMLGNELPDEVESNVSLDKLNEQEDKHGAAVAAVVHSVAPDAELYLANFDLSSFDSLIEAMRWLDDQDVQVVNYSIYSTVGPRDGTGADSPMVDAFVRDTGAVWVTIAGNEALGHSMVQFNAGDDNLHNFAAEGDEAVYAIPFKPRRPSVEVVLNWDGNWKGGEKNQYDVIITDEDGNELAVGNEARRGKKNHYPFQITRFTAERDKTYFLSIRRVKGTTDHTLDIFVSGGLMPDWAWVPAYSVTSPGDADSALTVGATGLSTDELEAYSSHGPTRDERLKPDITAPTGEKVAGYDRGFFGTSGAAPMVAGAAALVLQAFPDLTEGEVRAWLAENIVDLGDKGADAQFGAGRLALPEPSGENGDNNGDNDSEEPLIVIEDVRVKFNVKVGKDRGLQIKTTFELDGYQGKELAVVAIVVDEDGNSVPSALDKYDFNGTIGTGLILKPKRNQTVFKDVTLFIPNAAFADVEQDEVFLIVGAIDVISKDNANLLARSEPTKLRISRR